MAKWIKLLNTAPHIAGCWGYQCIIRECGDRKRNKFSIVIVTPRFEKLTLVLQPLYVFQQKTSINKVI